MRKLVFFVGLIAGSVAFAGWWRRHRRIGTDFVNRVVNPWLVRRGIVGASRDELGLIEHVGRKSGIVRQTPIHPVLVEGGYRIVVPVGESSEWVRNVLAAGHCRLILRDRIVELDEPVLERPAEVPSLGALARALFGWLGFRYLRLRTFEEGRPPEVSGTAPRMEREAAPA